MKKLIAILILAALTQSAAQAQEKPKTEGINTTGAPVIVPPSVFEEGTETRLSKSQLADVLPWAINSQAQLKDLLENTRYLSPSEAKKMLIYGIRDVVLKSAPKRTELLMRYVLNRALKAVTIIDQLSPIGSLEAVAQDVRILRKSAEIALNYYESDLRFLNGTLQSNSANLTAVQPFAQFGLDYAQVLMKLSQSVVMSGAAQYELQIFAAGLLQYDLNRDRNRVLYAPVIFKLQNLLALYPEKACNTPSAELITRMRYIKKIYLDSIRMIDELQRQANVKLENVQKSREQAISDLKRAEADALARAEKARAEEQARIERAQRDADARRQEEERRAAEAARERAAREAEARHQAFYGRELMELQTQLMNAGEVERSQLIRRIANHSNRAAALELLLIAFCDEHNPVIQEQIVELIGAQFRGAQIQSESREELAATINLLDKEIEKGNAASLARLLTFLQVDRAHFRNALESRRDSEKGAERDDLTRVLTKF